MGLRQGTPKECKDDFDKGSPLAGEPQTEERETNLEERKKDFDKACPPVTSKEKALLACFGNFSAEELSKLANTCHSLLLATSSDHLWKPLALRRFPELVYRAEDTA